MKFICIGVRVFINLFFEKCIFGRIMKYKFLVGFFMFFLFLDVLGNLNMNRSWIIFLISLEFSLKFKKWIYIILR